MSGHGFRNAGIFRINKVIGKNGEPDFYFSLILQHGMDETCCKLCGGCFEDKLFDGCVVNAQRWWLCRPQPTNFRSFKERANWSLRQN